MGTKTEGNLKEAFAGESQANRRYLAFPRRPMRKDTHKWPSFSGRLLRPKPSTPITIFGSLKGIKSTKENLQEAIGGETHEFKSMYPGMIEAAKSEKNDAAFQTFNFANQVEKIHASLYSKALENLGKNEVLDYYVCPVCGNTVEKAPPEKCPICGAPGKNFMKIA